MEYTPSSSDAETLEARSVRYLDALGLGHLAKKTLVRPDGTAVVRGGRELQFGEFLAVCEQDAGPHLEAFSRLPEEDPRHPIIRDALRQAVGQYIRVEAPEEGANG